MKRLMLICSFLLCGLLVSAANSGFTLTVELARMSKEKIVVEVNGKKQQVSFEEGELVNRLHYPELKAGYAYISVGNVSKTLYLEPGKDLTVKIISAKSPWVKDFEFTGENAVVNAYLVKDSITVIQPEDFRLEPGEFIRKQQRLTEENIQKLHSYHFDENFTKWEEIRIRYLVHKHATRYLVQHFWETPTKISGNEQYRELPEVKDYARSLVVDDFAYWDIKPYRDFCVGVVSACVREAFFNNDFIDETQKRCKFVVENFKDKELIECLIYRLLEICVIREKGKPLGDQLELYFSGNVKSPERVAAFEALKKEWGKMQKGAEFDKNSDYTDVQGNSFSFDSLKGKYVYIDVWATWCGPCCAEIPALKKLERKFHDKNIRFVSISVDHNKAAWLKKIKDEEMTGIQLYGGSRPRIMTDYRIEGIPRFILLDRDGKLVNLDMSRPSDPRTEESLNALKGI